MNKSINYQFGKHSTASEVLAGIDLSDHLVVLTGATSGIGIATAEALVGAGADLVVGARSMSKLEGLLARLRDINPKTRLYGFTLDLMSVDSVNAFADSVLELKRAVNILINNAGGLSSSLRRNDIGIEFQLMTNFVGHALLTSRLAQSLEQAWGARVISVSSVGHHYSPVVFDDLNFERRPYSVWDSYGQSKTANVLLAVKVSSALGASGVDAFALHPGIIHTDINSSLSREDLKRAKEIGAPAPDNMKTTEQGAATTVWAATEAQLKGRGPLFLEDCRIAEVLDKPNHQSGVMPYALSLDNANKLWDLTEKLLKRKLPLQTE